MGPAASLGTSSVWAPDGRIVTIQPTKGESWRCNLDHMLILGENGAERAPRNPSEW